MHNILIHIATQVNTEAGISVHTTQQTITYPGLGIADRIFEELCELPSTKTIPNGTITFTYLKLY